VAVSDKIQSRYNTVQYLSIYPVSVPVNASHFNYGSKIVPLQAIKPYKRSGGIAPLVFKLETAWM
jgi:hypothetical protein